MRVSWNRRSLSTHARGTVDTGAMKRILIVLAAVAAALRADAQSASPLAGVWTFNKALSEAPPEIGFNVAWLPSQSAAGQEPGAASGGRGRRGGGGGGGAPRGSGGAFSAPRESYE